LYEVEDLSRHDAVNLGDLRGYCELGRSRRACATPGSVHNEAGLYKLLSP
jgi:hypothetical protein